jgi:hypothetical protein
LPTIAAAQTRPCPPPNLSIEGGSSANTTCSPSNSAQDWQARISAAGVVWYHGFESDNEVNNFRWTPAYGVDPNAVGNSNSKLLRRITTDGSDKGNGTSCMEIVRAAGSNDGSCWWRVFSPLKGGTTTGNGRGAGQDDPGDRGAISTKSYSSTNRSQVEQWTGGGWYGNSRYHGSGDFDGTDYYFQCRVKIDANRIAGGNSSVDVGKLFYFTRNDRSATDQEIVVHSGHPISGRNYLAMYRSVSPGLASDAPGVSVHGNQPGTSLGNGICRFDNTSGLRANCWYWPENEWVTVLWHIRNGTMSGPLGSGSANGDTLVEVSVARAGATSYTPIWRQPGVDLPFDVQYGHNALIASIYHNGENMPVAFYHRYDQMIFSRQFIACPQA